MKRLARLLPLLLSVGLAEGVFIDFEKSEGPYSLSPLARVTGAGAISGSGSLECDSREASGAWNHCLTTAPGLFQPRTPYTISFRYRNLELGPESFLHLVLRDPAAGDRSTLFSLDLKETNRAHEKRIRVTIPESQNYSILIFIKGRGMALVDDLRIQEGDGLGYAPALPASERSGTPASGLPSGPGEFDIERPRLQGGPTLNVADFGASTAAADNLRAFSNALEACRERRAARLLIPPGTWRFESFDSPLVFAGLTNLSVEGPGAELVFFRTRPRGGNPFFRIQSCDHIAFKDFKVDWDWRRAPLASIVRVETTAPDGAWLDCRFIEYERFPNPRAQVRVMEGFDPVLKLVGFEGSKDLWEGHSEEALEWLEPNLGRVRSKAANQAARAVFRGIQAGQTFRMRHYNYDQGGFHIDDSTQMLFTNLTVYSCPGMAFIVRGESHHQEWSGVKILPRPGEPRPITCTADHFHVNNSMGWLKFEGCDFGYGGDDCINIHDNNFYAVPTGPATLEGRFFRAWATPVREGDPLELRREDLSPAGFTARVKSIRVNPQAQTARIELDRALPADLGELVVCFNRRYGSHHYLIRNNRFGRNRAAGFRLQADDGLVEGNLFYHHQMPAIRLETGWAMSGWSEGTGVSNLVIRNNTFIDCNPVKNEEHGPVLHMGVFRRSVSSPDQKSPYAVFSGILIESNAFINGGGAAMTISSAGRVLVRSNAFYGEKARQATDLNRSVIMVSFASNVEVRDNAWVRSPHVPRPGVLWDPETCPPPRCSGNRLTD
ncbi:MAG: right-handed parallel beta-helix repeat-containing protein [Spirochaetes bacterium]|nr:right-handed parallel beta-helix repeat-containing protein [Spirochaetota bacterium]